MRLVEASIAHLREALTSGDVTSVGLVEGYLRRIAVYDRGGILLNSVPVLNPDAVEEAAASDERRRSGTPRGPLDGIPYTAKDSYGVRGLTVAAGSPAFADLVATADAFVIERLRAAGAVCLGLTTMPPMACGGMQRGLYGRAESPYNADYLTSAYGSGSSNGSGTSTAASFAAFGLGEETWSSGRAPASNNGLVAYTPSRGLISMRGSWPLYVTMDVVVPHTRTTADLFEVLDVLVADDPTPRGDFWRVQTTVDLPLASSVRPTSYRDLQDPDALRGTRIGVPRMYVNADTESTDPIATRPSVITLWEQARADLTALGAEVVDVDFPAISHYEGDRPGAPTLATRGLVPPDHVHLEMWPLTLWAWDDFLDQHGRRLVDVDGDAVFPVDPGSLPDRYPDDPPMADLLASAREGIPSLEEMTDLPALLRGLEETRRVDLEDWMDALGLAAVVFPTAADVAPHDADRNPASNDIAWRNGVRYSNGNLAIRHLGIPTVTVPMGLMADTRMPVGLTFAGRAYDDNRLLAMAHAFESSGDRRPVPPRTPELPGEAG
jgi:amidase